MHALVLLCVNNHTEFKVLSFTDSKDNMIGSQTIKNGPRDGNVRWPRRVLPL